MKHKLLRGLVAVILVCCLVVSWSPIRAKAVGVDQFIGVAVDKVGLYAQAGAVSTGAAVFSWVLMGLGIIVTTAQAIDLMNRYTEFSGELETSIYYYPDGSWSYGVDMGFVERVRAWLFKDGILYLGPKIDTSMPASVVEALGVARANGCHYFYGTTLSGGYPFVAYCNKSYCMYLYYIYGSYQLQCGSGGPYTFVYKDETSTWSRTDGIQIKDGKIYKVGENEPVQTTDDAIKLGLISPPEVDIPTGYPEWHTNSRPATNSDTDEEITVLPIPLNPSADPETQIGTLTQPDIWQGSIADPMPGTDSVPDGSIAETPWEAFKKWISEGWKSIIQAIPTPDSIAEAVGNVIKSIFVPDADFITEKWNDIRSRFEFADSITATGEVLVNILDGLDPEPPVIYIDLGATEGSYNIGGEVAFIDLRWYARYKPTMDLIISAFLWLAFVWRLILKLPGIISGMPGEFVLMSLPVNLPLLGIGSGQRREELESGRNNRRLGDGH